MTIAGMMTSSFHKDLGVKAFATSPLISDLFSHGGCYC
ncbi:hypothetical protein HMPREF9243_2028 [Aerococcus sp. Group 1]|nr:hypothetical protein HMPREF9243_2028 [Aerococcus sp. Group 1]